MAIGEVMAGGAQAVNAGTGLFSMIYNAANQQKTWRREDTAVQRRTADLRAAGLSPTLAAGAAAQSSQAVRMGGTNLNPGAIAQAKLMGAQKKQSESSKNLADTQKRLVAQQAVNANELNKGIIQDNQTKMANAAMSLNEMLYEEATGVPRSLWNTPAGQAIILREQWKNADAAERALITATLGANLVK